jgi:hypothetical protein
MICYNNDIPTGERITLENIDIKNALEQMPAGDDHDLLIHKQPGD